MDIFTGILILLTAAVVTVSLCRRMKLPPIIGYLAVGVICGPGGLNFVSSPEDFHYLAEFGVVFLMFTLGLEFSIPRLIAAKKVLLGVGSLQVFSCLAAVFGVALYFGLSPAQSFIVGAALALSSTAVVVKQLDEQQERNTSHGQLSINILLFQDIAAVLFLIVVTAIGAESESASLPMALAITLTKGILVSVAMALIGLRVLRPMLHEVAKAHSTELFMLATLFVILSSAWITEHIGLSMALGAFLAGMMLGETEFKHQLEIDIRPFQDVLLGLFFVVIGSYFDLGDFPEYWDSILLILVTLIVGKTILIMMISLIMKQGGLKSSLKTGIILAHGGEFGFVILTLAIQYNLISDEERPALFSAMVLSVMLAPLMIRYNKELASIFVKKKDFIENKDHVPQQLVDHASEIDNHIIICGYGRVGQIITKFLDREHIPWVALDLDPYRISKASLAGEHSYFGDATNPKTLAAAGLYKARMIVITFGNESCALEALQSVRSLHQNVPVFVRTKNDTHMEQFQAAGATEVVPEKLEGSLMLASHLLLSLGIPTNRILAKLRKIHSNRYKLLREFFTGSDDFVTQEADDVSRRSLHSFIVTDCSWASEKDVATIMIATPEQASLKSLTRGLTRYQPVPATLTIKPGDVLVFLATPEEITLLDELLLSPIGNNINV
jgi:CPA2 family monovalent cation:H+ antiporter-2